MITCAAVVVGVELNCSTLLLEDVATLIGRAIVCSAFEVTLVVDLGVAVVDVLVTVCCILNLFRTNLNQI